MMERLVVGTRGSRLALWQADYVVEALAAIAPDLDLSIETITTGGDHFQNVPLAALHRGIFIKEIDDALLEGRIDLAVHSLKDVPTVLPEGVVMPAVLAREDVRDCVFSRSGRPLAALPPGAVVGTSSLRRRAQLAHLYPALVYEDIRGNVQTRLRKLDQGGYDAIVLALAGVRRLGLDAGVAEILDPDRIVPAVGQAALAVTCRGADSAVVELLGRLDHRPTRWAVEAERALLRHLEGGCSVPVGGLGRVDGERLRLVGCIADLGGVRCVRWEIEGAPEEARRLGRALAQTLLDRGGRQILDELRSGRGDGV